jgi:transposase-like protein
MGRGDRDLGKEQFWRGLLRQWDSRKQTVREFCAEHGVSQPSFYAWRRTIAQRDQQSARPIAAKAAKAAEDQAAFVPVKVMALTPNPMLEVVATSGHLVRVPPEFDAATLRRLLAVLEEATPC